MKTRILIPVLVGLTLASTLFSCQQGSGNEATEQELRDSINKIEEAKMLVDEEFKKFKVETDEKIKENEKRIIELREKMKEKMKKSDEKIRAKYNEKVDALEEKNKALNKKLGEYKDEGKEKWEEFKREFNHDMDELGQAIKDLFNDNTK